MLATFPALLSKKGAGARRQQLPGDRRQEGRVAHINASPLPMEAMALLSWPSSSGWEISTFPRFLRCLKQALRMKT